MDLDAKKIHAFLKENKIDYLFHSNTICTSKSFIDTSALLSREYMESNSLELTPQKTDSLDKKFDIYNNVFLDGWDLALLYEKPNIYGPVTFKLSVDLLLEHQTLKITRSNPYYWDRKQWWFESEDEYFSRFPKFDKLDKSHTSFVFGEKISFNNLLDSITFDKPGKNISDEVFIKCVNHILGSMVNFKSKFPNVNLYQRERFVHHWNNFPKDDFLRFYKRTFIES